MQLVQLERKIIDILKHSKHVDVHSVNWNNKASFEGRIGVLLSNCSFHCLVTVTGTPRNIHTRGLEIYRTTLGFWNLQFLIGPLLLLILRGCWYIVPHREPLLRLGDLAPSVIRWRVRRLDQYLEQLHGIRLRGTGIGSHVRVSTIVALAAILNFLFSNLVWARIRDRCRQLSSKFTSALTSTVNFRSLVLVWVITGEPLDRFSRRYEHV